MEPNTYQCQNKRQKEISVSSGRYRTGKCHSCGIKGKKNHFYGKTMVGKLNPRYIDGRSYLPYSIEFSEKLKESIRKRDNYTCQACGDSKGGNLNAHHIKNFIDNESLRLDVNNGITLCKNCHSPEIEGSFHYLYGTHNNTKEQLEEYIQNKKKLKEVT